MKIDCNKQCDFCPATICEKRGNYIDAGAINKINEKIFYYNNKTMKLKDAIDTVISHNALVSLDMRDNDDPHYSKCVYSGMAHEIPGELLEY